MITNKDVALAAKAIFTTSNEEFRRPLPMAGRQAAMTAFIEASLAEERQIITISGLLGGGKTFFLQHAIGAIRDKHQFAESTNCKFHFASRGAITRQSIDEGFSDPDPAHRLMLVIEELDRKARYAKLIACVDAAIEWLQSTSDGILVLTGDRFLEHPEFLRRAHGVGVQVTRIALEPLELPLMQEAIDLRLYGAREPGERPPPPEDRSRAAAEIVSDPVIAQALVPPTNPPSATWREAFGLLTAFAPLIDRNVPRVAFPATLVHEHLAMDPPPHLPIDRQRIYDHVLERTKEALCGGPPVKPLTFDDLVRISGTDRTESDFRKNVAFPLITAQVLDTHGIPYLGDGGPDDQLRFPEPYLPRLRTVLRAIDALLTG